MADVAKLVERQGRGATLRAQHSLCPASAPTIRTAPVSSRMTTSRRLAPAEPLALQGTASEANPGIPGTSPDVSGTADTDSSRTGEAEGTRRALPHGGLVGFLVGGSLLRYAAALLRNRDAPVAVRRVEQVGCIGVGRLPASRDQVGQPAHTGTSGGCFTSISRPSDVHAASVSRPSKTGLHTPLHLWWFFPRPVPIAPPRVLCSVEATACFPRPADVAAVSRSGDHLLSLTGRRMLGDRAGRALAAVLAGQPPHQFAKGAFLAIP